MVIVVDEAKVSIASQEKGSALADCHKHLNRSSGQKCRPSLE